MPLTCCPVDHWSMVPFHKYHALGNAIGNPHCVIPVAAPSSALAMRLGPLIERHPIFPYRTNLQFVRVIDRRRIQIEIWERGAGHTPASGSSNCAAAAACVRFGLCDPAITVVNIAPGYNAKFGGTSQ
jgi:diaminopimelate epimerase